MKKQLLMSMAVVVGGITYAQNSTVVTKPTINPNAAKASLPYEKAKAGASDADLVAAYANKMNQKHYPQNVQNRAFVNTIIGTTGYQLQTNASVCRRMIVKADGTMSATWTMSMVNDAAWADRGTGYNYFNGTSWGAAPTARQENIRVGWPNVGLTTGGKEVIVTHEASNVHHITRGTFGSGAWTDAALGHPDVWPRLAVGGANGMTLHVISQTTGVGNPPFMGQDGAVSYSRSLDGGTTWDKLRTVIPQIDASSYLGFGGDSYSIDAKGDTIAIVLGGFDVDVVLIKSINNGDTWTKTIVKAFPISMFDGTTTPSDVDGDSVADTVETNDASLHVLLDNQGMAHVWYGGMRVFSDGTGLSYFPFTDGLYYWNESMGATAPYLIATALDLNANSTLDVTAQGRYQTSMSSMPSAGIDASGAIYVAYSSLFEGDAENGTPGDGNSYRHIYLLKTSDNGQTWCGPLDVTDPNGSVGYMEGVFPSVAKRVNADVHLVQQIDAVPGHGIGTSNPDVNNNGQIADMVYTKTPVADFTSAPCYSVVGINELGQNNATISVYPNPAFDVVNISIASKVNAKAVVSVYNSVGQKVSQITSNLTVGANTLNVNTSNYDAGIYFISANIEGKLYTQKVIVK